jgi:hypothetical protein
VKSTGNVEAAYEAPFYIASGALVIWLTFAFSALLRRQVIETRLAAVDGAE